MHKERITLEMTMLDCVVALSEGNPGAVTVIGQLMKQSPLIDPQSAFGPMAPLFALDVHGIYGCRIWMLFKDVCRHDIGSVLALLRAVQLGFRTESQLNRWIDGIDRITAEQLSEIKAEVCARLEEFNPNATAEPQPTV